MAAANVTATDMATTPAPSAASEMAASKVTPTEMASAKVAAPDVDSADSTVSQGSSRSP